MPTHELNYRAHAHPKPMGMGADGRGRGRGHPMLDPAVKWTSLDLCLVLSESDSTLCTNFEFVQEKNHRHFKYILFLCTVF